MPKLPDTLDGLRRAALHAAAPLLIALGGALAPAATAQSQPASESTSQTTEKKRLTLEAIYGPGQVDFDGSHASGMTWVDATHFLHRRDGTLMKVDAVSDAAEPAYDVEGLKAALLASKDFNDEQASRIARNPGDWTADRTNVLIRHEKKLYVYRVADKKVMRIADSDEGREELELGPTGRFIAYVQKNDLHLVDTHSGKHRRITKDGERALARDTPEHKAAGGTILNGKLDWVYQEEIYGRGTWRAFWFSPSESHVAFLRLDEAQVPVYTVIDPIPYHQTPERLFYPKAGDPNPIVSLGVARTRDGKVVWVDLSRYTKTNAPFVSFVQNVPDYLIVQVSWSPDGRLIFSVQDREETWMDVNEADPEGGASRTLFRENSPAWVENFGKPRWLKDGSFLWLSDRDGYRHLYLYARDGHLLSRVTQGEWQVKSILAVDETANWVYFNAEKDSVFETDAYRVPILGGSIQRLTEPGFNHSVAFAPAGGLFIDTFSNTTTPPKVHLRRGPGGPGLERVVSENDVHVLDQYVVSKAEFLRIPARDGHLLNAELIRPADFDPTRKYPVWCPVYAGPDSPTISNGWNARGYLFDQYMANEMGIIIWRCDPRSASGNSKTEAWHAYAKLGVTELEDIEDGLKWLISQGGVDESRIGIAGHSYGGYMTAYALTHSTMFKCGIAGAPVTDWRNYDSIYTERYMKLPKNNPEGYDVSSCVKAAENLHGRLLIAHGSIDENVHMANTQQFITELQRHRKLFDLMNYPKDRHGFGNGGRHWREMQLDFIRWRL